tara:strand:- start:423 stop:941 length:519 start_codon:yes stop_codon:yes gene_type:complete
MPITLNGSGAVTGLSQLPDSAMAAGSVIQTVEATTNTQVTSSSTSLEDTNLSASITPSSTSSKILVLVNQAYCPFRDSGSGVNGRLTLVRDSTTILDHTLSMNDSLGFSVQNYNAFLRLGMRVPLFKLDSPGTTSSVTYKTQFATIATSNTGRVQAQRDSMVSTIELLEIAG